eukprot:11161921-Lingulodinium_polyedra.AAC.1
MLVRLSQWGSAQYQYCVPVLFISCALGQGRHGPHKTGRCMWGGGCPIQSHRILIPVLLIYCALGLPSGGQLLSSKQ